VTVEAAKQASVSTAAIRRTGEIFWIQRMVTTSALQQLGRLVTVPFGVW
jgi:hypothetical protein